MCAKVGSSRLPNTKAGLMRLRRLHIMHGSRSNRGKGTSWAAFLRESRTLQQIGVSSPLLDRLVQAALDVGAEGKVKWWRAGWQMLIALIKPKQRAGQSNRHFYKPSGFFPRRSTPGRGEE